MKSPLNRGDFVFGYRSGNSILHKLDIRFKIIFLVLISLTSLHANLYGLLMLGFVILASLISARISLFHFLKKFRYFLILLIFVFVARVLSSYGIYNAVTVCGRLAIIFLMGLLFVSTTKPSQIKTAVEWFLKPFPFIPNKRAAVMMSLMMRFIPVILNQAKTIGDAQCARGIENRKNPVYKLIKLSGSLIRQTFSKADKLVDAMQARCYNDNRTGAQLFAPTKKDWTALSIVICLCVTILATI